MISKSLLAVSALMVLGLPSHARAAPQRITELIKLMVTPDDMASASSRLALINAADRYCSALKTQFPTNSPAEDRWLDGELEVSGPRISRAMESPEVGRRLVKNFTTKCLSATQQYLHNGDKKNALISLGMSMAVNGDDMTNAALGNDIDPIEWGIKGLPVLVPTVLRAALREP